MINKHDFPTEKHDFQTETLFKNVKDTKFREQLKLTPQTIFLFQNMLFYGPCTNDSIIPEKVIY